MAGRCAGSLMMAFGRFVFFFDVFNSLFPFALKSFLFSQIPKIYNFLFLLEVGEEDKSKRNFIFFSCSLRVHKYIIQSIQYTQNKKIQFTVVLTLVMYWWKPTQNSSRYAYCEQLPLNELDANSLEETDDDDDNSTAIAVQVQSASSPRYDEEEMKTAYYGFSIFFLFSLVNERDDFSLSSGEE